MFLTRIVYEPYTFLLSRGERPGEGIACFDEDEDIVLFCISFVSSDRSSYSDGGLLYIIHPRPLFEILSISANIFSFSFCELNAD